MAGSIPANHRGTAYSGKRVRVPPLTPKITKDITMGSFNASCAISNAPIRGGDEVVLFYVVNQDRVEYDGDSNTFRGIISQADCHFQLVGFPMKAKYNDCAIFTVQQSLASDLTLQIMKRHFTSTPYPKDDKYADPEYYGVEKKSLTHEKVQDLIREGMLYFDSNADLSRRRFVSQIAIHTEVFDELMKFTKIRAFSDDPDDYQSFEFFNVQDYFNHGIKTLRENIKKEKMKFDLNYNMFNAMIGTVSESDGKVFTAEDAYRAALSLSPVVHTHEDRNSFSYANYNAWWNIRSLYESGSYSAPLEDVFEELYMYKCITTAFYCACNEVQKPFLPTVTASQDDNIRTNAVMNINVGLALLNKVRENHESNYGMPFTIQQPLLETKLSDFKKYFEEHWSTEISEKGLAAVEYVKRFKPVVELSQNNIEQLNLHPLMDAMMCHDITLKIIIDL